MIARRYLLAWIVLLVGFGTAGCGPKYFILNESAPNLSAVTGAAQFHAEQLQVSQPNLADTEDIWQGHVAVFKSQYANHLPKVMPKPVSLLQEGAAVHQGVVISANVTEIRRTWDAWNLHPDEIVAKVQLHDAATNESLYEFDILAQGPGNRFTTFEGRISRAVRYMAFAIGKLVQTGRPGR